MWLIAGLGNPGKRYEGTRHNVGFWVIDELQRRHMHAAYRSKFGAEEVTGLIRGSKVVLLKPMEFMNKSGYAIQRAAQFYDVPPENIVVVHDELDLDPARLRLKQGGGHGGHNGLRSIIQELGSKDFLRIRLGIGKPSKDSRIPGADYVLAQLSGAEKTELESAADRAADAAESILIDGMTQAMNTFNGVSPS